MRQGLAHHRPAQQQARGLRGVAAGLFHQVRHGRAQRHHEIARPRHAAAGHGHHARSQRFAQRDGAPCGARGGHVLHHHADVARQPAARHFPAGEHLDELALAAGGIAGGHFDHLYLAFANGRRGRACGGQRLGHGVLDRQQRVARAHHARHQPPAAHHFFGAFAQQRIVAGNPWLAFRAVEHQQFARHRQFAGGGETGAAQAHHARGADAFAQCDRVGGLPVQRRQGVRGLRAGGLDQHVWRIHAREAGQRVRRHRQHAAGAGRMHVGAWLALGYPDALAGGHVVARGHAGEGRRAGVLQQRHPQQGRQVAGLQPAGRGLGLVAGQRQPAVEGMQAHPPGRCLSGR